MKPRVIASRVFVFVVLHLLQNSNQTALLSLRFEGSACPNQEAEYVCTTNTGLLIWSTETYIKRYSKHTDPSNYIVQLGIFTASLLNLTSDGHVTARLVTNATLDKNGTELVCRDGFFMDKATAVLLVAIVADAPKNLRLISTTYNTAVLQWTEPSSTGVDLHYHVIISPPLPTADLFSLQMDDYNVTSTTIQLTGLQHGVNYTVMVSAVNCAGESNFSTPLTVLLSAQVPASPQDLSVCVYKLNGTTVLRSTWKRPRLDDMAPPVTNYLLSVGQHHISSWKQVDVSASSGCEESYQWEMTVQENSKMFTVVVKSNNTIGTSNNSAKLTINATRLVSINVTLVSPTSVLLIPHTDSQYCNNQPLSMVLVINHSSTYYLTSKNFLLLQNFSAGAAYNYILMENDSSVTYSSGQFIMPTVKTQIDDKKLCTTPTPSAFMEAPCTVQTFLQAYAAAVAGFVTVLLIISVGISTFITCMCIHGARAFKERRSSSQQEQSAYNNQELAAQYCRPSGVQLPACGIPGSTGNLSLFCNEAYEQLQQSTPMNFIQQDDDVYEKLPDLD